MKIRVGFGFDVHQLVEGRELWLGGILLEHTKGLLGPVQQARYLRTRFQRVNRKFALYSCWNSR